MLHNVVKATCDRCKESKEGQWKQDELPHGWGRVAIIKTNTLDLCEKCFKEINAWIVMREDRGL